MKTIELPFPELIPAQKLEDICSTVEAILSVPMQLASYPGSVHWHISKPAVKGTLEATWWPKNGRFWLKVASNRDAPWIDEAIREIQNQFGANDLV
jgi:hypothetical protein